MPRRTHASSCASFLSNSASCSASTRSSSSRRLEIGVVAGAVAAERAAIEIEDAGGEVAQEAAVVGDEDQRAAPALQRLLEVLDRVDVEVVRRLVQEQQVGIAHQRRGEQHPPLGSGRQRLESASRSSGQVAAPPGRCGSRSPRRRRSRVTPQTSCRYARTVPREVERHVLLQARHAQSGLPDHVAGVGRERALEDLEQRRLAGAVAAEQAEPLAVVDLEIHGVQQRRARRR